MSNKLVNSCGSGSGLGIGKRSYMRYMLLLFITLISMAGLFTSVPARGAEPDLQAKENSRVMSVDDIAKELYALTQYSIDGVFILSQASESLSNNALKAKILTFRDEAEEHMKELSALVEQYGRTPPSYTRDFKGFFMQGYTALRGMMSNKGVMEALHGNFKIIINAYEKALKMQLPEEVKEKVRSILESKRKQDAYVVSQL